MNTFQALVRRVRQLPGNPAVIRFLKYAAVGGGTFAIDLTLMAFLTMYEGMPYPLATFISFSLGISVNYLLSRKYIFCGTARSLRTGYVNMMLAATVGAFFTTSLTVLAVQALGIGFMAARFGVAAFVGIGNYLFNLYINFQVVGQHQPVQILPATPALLTQPLARMLTSSPTSPLAALGTPAPARTRDTGTPADDPQPIAPAAAPTTRQTN